MARVLRHVGPALRHRGVRVDDGDHMIGHQLASAAQLLRGRQPAITEVKLERVAVEAAGQVHPGNGRLDGRLPVRHREDRIAQRYLCADHDWRSASTPADVDAVAGDELAAGLLALGVPRPLLLPPHAEATEAIVAIAGTLASARIRGARGGIRSPP